MPTTSRTAVEQAIAAYFAALMSHDASAVPLADDVVFHSPTVHFEGKAAVQAHLQRLNWLRLRVLQHIIDGDHCASEFEYDRPEGVTIYAFDHFSFENGQLKSIRPYFDASALQAARAAASAGPS
jgi:hypothetical protein